MADGSTALVPQGSVSASPEGSDLRAAAPVPPTGVAWLPTEQALILSAALPPLPAAQRRAAVGFAVEDRIAQPLERVVVALGPVIAGAHVIVVAARRDIAAWRAAHGGPTVRLLPDVLALPVPAQGWAVWVGGARALVRLADGTGFAVPVRDLPLLWRHGGCPEIALCGGDLP
ncbi:MAG: hypothetical protein H7245_00420, partial [Candidatus Saccharibacteria bacterium]|nr:hypothetical protein [Pseudorhodobacter sp.]